MNSWIEIKDLGDFVYNIRKKSYELFVEENNKSQDIVAEKIKENKLKIEDILSEKEVHLIIAPEIKKYKNKYRISQKKLNKIIESLNSRMISNSIKELSSREVFEIGFDNKINDFIFWTK